jgi:DNA-binding MurR/RpiR family transcriptional regulator
MSEIASPPETYEKLMNEITRVYPSLSNRFQQIARYLTQNPNVVALQSTNAVAEKCDAHPSSLVRFAQQLGYSGFKELQTVFQTRLVTAAPGFSERISALRDELQLHEGKGNLGFLGDLVVRDIASLQELLSSIREEDLEIATKLMQQAETIYIAGQLRSEPIALFLRYVLTMLRRRVVLLDATGGLAAESAKVITRRDTLVAVSFRYYAKEVVGIAETAAQNGAPVIVISDSQLSPLAKNAQVLFSVPEDEYTFSRSLAAPICLAQSLAISLAAALAPEAEGTPRIPIATEQSQAR